MADGEVPGFFKAWGAGDDVWVVGGGGAVLHRKSAGPFEVVPTGVKDTLFTVNGTGDRLLVVGGGSSGVLLDLDGRTPPSFHDGSPPGAGLIQGVFASDRFGDWASGERGFVYTRKGKSPFALVEHGLQMPASSSLHSIFVDPSGGVWSAGGNVLSPRSTTGCSFTTATHVPPVAYRGRRRRSRTPEPRLRVPRTLSTPARTDRSRAAGTSRSSPGSAWISRGPRCTRATCYHVSAAMWDAWAGYDTAAKGVFVRERHTAPDVDEARRAAISYAAYDVLAHRYEHAIGGPRTLACLRAVMRDLGYDPNDAHDTGDDPIAFGNRIGHTIIRERARRRRERGQRLRRLYQLPAAQPGARVRQPRRPPERARAMAAASTSRSPLRKTASSCPRACRRTSARSGAW